MGRNGLGMRVMPTILGALIGDNLFEQKKIELEQEYEPMRLQQRVRAEVLAGLARKFPDKDASELAKSHPEMIRRLEARLAAHYQATKKQKLDLLARLEHRD